MRCAILISGYTRTFAKTYDNLTNFINSNKNIKFDLFISVNEGEKELGKHKGSINTLNSNINLLKKLNPKILYFNDLENTKLEDTNNTQYLNLSNLYDLFIEYSKNNGINYDLLIRSRFDNLILKHPNLESMVKMNKKIIVPSGFFYGLSSDLKFRLDKVDWWKKAKDLGKIDEKIKYNFIINDRFAIGGPDSMKYYFNFGEIESKIHDFTSDIFGLKSTEGAMAFHLKRNGIRIIWDEKLITQIVR